LRTCKCCCWGDSYPECITNVLGESWLSEFLSETETTEEKNKGWECPVCHTKWAPHVQYCKKCEKNEENNPNPGPEFLTE